MHRFHLPPEQCRGTRFQLSPTDAHHAAQVLRLGPGDPVTLLDGAGTIYSCRVTAVRKREVEVEPCGQESCPPLPTPLTLIQAVTKPKSMEWIVQKSVELGVHRIVPVLSDRSVVRLDAEQAAERQVRWQSLIVEAAKQCGLAWFPQIDPPRSLAACQPRITSLDWCLYAALEAGAAPVRTTFDSYVHRHGHTPRSAGVAVGPEGDFTPEELATLRTLGSVPVTLGPLVLRAETAAICALAILQHELGYAHAHGSPQAPSATGS